MRLTINNLLLKASFVAFFFSHTFIAALAQQGDVDLFLKNTMNELHIPGMQVAIVQGGKMVLNKSYGIANIQDSVPVTNNSIFGIYSCTKAFTGVAIMQLVEEGKLELSAPLSQYLDSLPSPWQAVTIQQLLTHISGLPDILPLLNSSPFGFGELGDGAAAWEKVKTLPMEFARGEAFAYNQTNYLLLGKIIDKLTGKPFTQVFKERQFQLAGMPNTLFGDSRNVIPHLAPSYRLQDKGEREKMSQKELLHTYAQFPSYLQTGSGLNSTATDMARWIIALQKGKLLKTKTALTTLWTAGTYNNGSPTQWALGWGLTKFRPKHKAVGMSGGGRSAFLIYPDDELAVIILTNLAGSFPENFIEEVAGYYNPGIWAADPITRLGMHLKKRGFEQAILVYEELKKKDSNFKPAEVELNDWGYRLLGSERKKALEIFKLNVFIYPQSWNVYDSYGEALVKNGQKEEAIKMYRKSLELNPDNKGGKEVLEKLSQK